MSITKLPEFGVWPIKTISIEEFRKLYPKKDKPKTSAIESKITKRLEHVKERIILLSESHGSGLTIYARGFSVGKLHRLIAERYFLETLLEEV